jgi:hypothetical protein
MWALQFIICRDLNTARGCIIPSCKGKELHFARSVRVHSSALGLCSVPKESILNIVRGFSLEDFESFGAADENGEYSFDWAKYFDKFASRLGMVEGMTSLKGGLGE